MNPLFAHTHTHSEYSLRDAITSPEAMMKKAAEYQMGISLTDHGTLAGIWKAAKYAKKYGVKFSPGIEVYVVPDIVKCRGKEWSSKGKSAHLVLNAVDTRGWENLLKLNTRSNSEGFYCQPRVDYKMLREHADGVWASSACLGGCLAKAWRAGQSVHLLAELLREIYGERFSLEIQLNNREEQESFNEVLFQVSRDTRIPLIATVDSHYLEKSDSHKQDLVFCLGIDKLLNDPERHRYPPEAHSLETPDDVIKKFVTRYGAIGEKAINRTLDLINEVSVTLEIESKNYKMPTVSIAEMEDYNEFLLWKEALLKSSRI